MGMIPYYLIFFLPHLLPKKSIQEGTIMSFDWIAKAFIAPVFFYLCIVMAGLTAATLYAAFAANTSYVVLACILFVLGFNAFRQGWKLMQTK